MSNLIPNTYQTLKEQIKTLFARGREHALRSVNTILVQTYWHIGRHIVEYEQQGNVKAGYGSALLTKLSKDLTLEYGKGFSRSNLFQMRQFYVRFPKIQTLSEQLSWSHYCEILKADDEMERHFYLKSIKYWKITVAKKPFFPTRPDASPTIYAYKILNAADREGLLKVGYTTRNARQRVAEQLKTCGLKYEIVLEEAAIRTDGTAFSDHDVHRALKQQAAVEKTARYFAQMVVEQPDRSPITVAG